MRSLMVALCGSVPLLFGSTSFTVDNADLVHVSGPGPVQVLNGTPLHQNASENGSPWSGLYTRNAGQQSIVFEADAPGTYQLKIWSIPSDPMNPQRVLSTDTVVVDGDGGGQAPPYDVSDLLALLAAWGECPSSGSCVYDLNGDGLIDASDLLILLANWG